MGKTRLFFWIAAAICWVAGLFVPIFEFQNGRDESWWIRVRHAYSILGSTFRAGQTYNVVAAMSVSVVIVHVGGALVLAGGLTVGLRALQTWHSPGEHSLFVPVAWYDATQYGRLLELATDPESLEPTFEAWERKATLLIENLREQGTQINTILVDVQEMARWCQEQGHAVDVAARIQYVHHLASSDRLP